MWKEAVASVGAESADCEPDMSAFLIDPAGGCGWSYPESFIESVHQTRHLTRTLAHLTDDRIPLDLSLPFSSKLWFESGLGLASGRPHEIPPAASAQSSSNAPRGTSPAPGGPDDVARQKPSGIDAPQLIAADTHDFRRNVFSGQIVYCEGCSTNLLSGTRNGLECGFCHLKIHDTCRDRVITRCPKERSPPPPPRETRRSPAPLEQASNPSEFSRMGSGTAAGRRPMLGVPDARERSAASGTGRPQTPSQRSADSYASDGAGSPTGGSQPSTPSGEMPELVTRRVPPQKPGRQQPPASGAPARQSVYLSGDLRTIRGPLYKQPNSLVHSAWTLRYCSIDLVSREVPQEISAYRQ